MTYARIYFVKRTTIFIDHAAERELSALARKEARSKAELVREAVGEYLARKSARQSLPGFTAIGASSRSDIDANHEQELFAELTPHGDAE